MSSRVTSVSARPPLTTHPASERMPAGAIVKVALLVVFAGCIQVQASTCLRESAPEVIPFLVSGDQQELLAAVENLNANVAGISTANAAPWLTAQASMLIDLGELERAETLLNLAIDGWYQNGRIDGELCARRLLVFSMSLRSQTRQALVAAEFASLRASAAGLSAEENRIAHTRVSLLMTLNERLEEALLLLDQSQPGSAPSDQVNWHHIRGLMLSRLNRHYEAVKEFEEVLELSRQQSLKAMAATARLNLATQLALTGRDNQQLVPHSRIETLLRTVTDDPSARLSTRAIALRALAQMQPDDQRIGLLEKCVEVAHEAQDDRRRAVCLADMAELSLASDPQHAQLLINQAIRLADAEPRALWQIQLQRLNVLWAMHSPLQAFSASLDVLDGERMLRERQLSGPDLVRFIDGLNRDYRRLAARAYAHAFEYQALASEAFAILESNRAQVLRHRRLQLRDKRQALEEQSIVARINRLQLRLLNLDSNAQARQQINRELEDLQIQWRYLLTQEPGEVESLPPPASLQEVQSALAADEALLSFLTGLPNDEPDVHGWLHLITQTESRLLRVPGHHELTAAADAVEGIVDFDQASSRSLLDSLHDRLLASAADSLPAHIRHLVIVPDSGIDRLPLELLTDADGRILGERFSIDIAPSASIWLTTRTLETEPGKVLVLADPDVSKRHFQALSEAFPRYLPDALPAAVREARAIQSMLGHNTVLLRQGRQAREASLPGLISNQGAGVIHFATHSLVDARRPEASAVVLTAGSDTDGMLQPPEIEQLNLSGTAVVLASCASATGETLDNEGIVSLARSFLIAGSPSVIASRWPVSDQHAQAFFVRMYWHLSHGHSLSESMRLARIELREQGFPRRIWSAFVLYGDGRRDPVQMRSNWPAWILIAVAGLLILLMLAKVRKL